MLKTREIKYVRVSIPLDSSMIANDLIPSNIIFDAYE